MEICKIWAVYFSPTGGTKRITRMIAEQIGERLQKEVCEIDYTKREQRERACHFGQDDLVVFGVPVYAGRIPNKILPDIEKGVWGDNTALIPVTAYGNRSFDDALMELKTVLEKQGFCPLAAAAVVSRHAFSDSLAAGRPDGDDGQEVLTFAKEAAEKLKKDDTLPPLSVAGNNPVGGYYVPLQEDGAPARFLKAKPVTDNSKCDGCGICAEVCPMDSNDRLDYSLVPGICIKCQACVQNCPAGAKAFTDKQFLSHVRMLEDHYSRRAENCFFL